MYGIQYCNVKNKNLEHPRAEQNVSPKNTSFPPPTRSSPRRLSGTLSRQNQGQIFPSASHMAQASPPPQIRSAATR
jgi:hypothetical protein